MPGFSGKWQEVSSCITWSQDIGVRVLAAALGSLASKAYGCFRDKRDADNVNPLGYLKENIYHSHSNGTPQLAQR